MSRPKGAKGLQRLMAEAECHENQQQQAGEGGCRENGGFIVALLQNRAQEVGLAALDLGRMELQLAQFVEQSRTFTLTLTMLELHPPVRLVLLGAAAGRGAATANEAGEAVAEGGINAAVRVLGVPVAAMPRASFDDSRGYMAVCKLALPDTRPGIEGAAVLATNYLAFGAAGALLQHVEQDQAQVLAASSVTVRCGASPLHMQIDRPSLQALELVQSSQLGSSNGGRVGGRRGPVTLFQLLNKTKTRCGSRMLRASLLQPLRDVETLNMRYDAVEELANSEEMLYNVTACLAQMPADMDRVCGSLSLRPVKSEAAMLPSISAYIHAFILLKELLAALPPLAQALAPASSVLLRAMGQTAGHAAFVELLQELDGLLEEDVASSRNAFLNRIQQCFAVRMGRDGRLDVARQSFSRITGQIHDLAGHLREQHGLPHLRAQYTARRGFYFSLSAPPAGGGRGGRRGGRSQEQDWEQEEEQGDDRATQCTQQQQQDSQGGSRWQAQATWQAGRSRLNIPPGFSVLQSNGRTAQLTTHELNALNSRLRDACNDCLVLTEQVLEQLSQRIVSEHLPVLHRLVDATALLDMLAAFAQLVCSSSRQYVRPSLTSAGPIAIVEGRHPVLEAQEGGAAYQPNDAYLSLSSSFHVITGPNMSGKSTFLRQVALTVVMAQVGCLVPAAFASLAPADRLLTRMGTGDSLETNSSSFMMEMQELAHILGQATQRSLVLIDELGRATSTADGVGIAWAASEQLIALGCPTLFATHFHQCTELARLYPSCRAWHLSVSTASNRLDFSWRLEAGSSEAGHYGLLLARLVGFPEDVLQQAEEVVAALDEAEAARCQAYAAEEEAQAGETVSGCYALAHKLGCIAEAYQANGDQRALLRQLKALKAEAQALLGGATEQPSACTGVC